MGEITMGDIIKLIARGIEVAQRQQFADYTQEELATLKVYFPFKIREIGKGTFVKEYHPSLNTEHAVYFEYRTHAEQYAIEKLGNHWEEFFEIVQSERRSESGRYWLHYYRKKYNQPCKDCGQPKHHIKTGGYIDCRCQTCANARAAEYRRKKADRAAAALAKANAEIEKRRYTTLAMYAQAIHLQLKPATHKRFDCIEW